MQCLLRFWSAMVLSLAAVSAGAQAAAGADCEDFKFCGAIDPTTPYPTDDVTFIGGSTYGSFALAQGPNGIAADQNQPARNLTAFASRTKLGKNVTEEVGSESRTLYRTSGTT